MYQIIHSFVIYVVFLDRDRQASKRESLVLEVLHTFWYIWIAS